MQIFGFDFTSAPSSRKPIVRARGNFLEGSLQIDSIEKASSFDHFEAWLNEPGPWIGGFDLPFGLPRVFIEEVGWPLDWSELVRHLETIGKHRFEAVIHDYRCRKETGKKEPLRHTDQRNLAFSPLKLYHPPVGKMLFQGIPRLFNSGVALHPCYQNGSNRLALEVFPRSILPDKRAQYKSDERGKQSEAQREARQQILALLARATIKLSLSDTTRTACLEDGAGDSLDACLCALAVARAIGVPNFGIPLDVDRLEGWIVSPCDDDGRGI